MTLDMNEMLRNVKFGEMMIILLISYVTSVGKIS